SQRAWIPLFVLTIVWAWLVDPVDTPLGGIPSSKTILTCRPALSACARAKRKRLSTWIVPSSSPAFRPIAPKLKITAPASRSIRATVSSNSTKVNAAPAFGRRELSCWRCRLVRWFTGETSLRRARGRVRGAFADQLDVVVGVRQAIGTVRGKLVGQSACLFGVGAGGGGIVE